MYFLICEVSRRELNLFAMMFFFGNSHENLQKNQMVVANWQKFSSATRLHQLKGSRKNMKSASRAQAQLNKPR